VEAARAGEAGAGFAVVADEVRNLVKRAAEAAKNTEALIDSTVKKVSDGTALEVAGSTAKVGELLGEIAAASSEQAQGIEQVNIAVTEMDKVTQQNAATAEESASASEKLSDQAEDIKSFIADLAAMVGKYSTISTGSSHTAKGLKTTGQSSQNRHKPLAVDKIPARGKALTHNRSKIINPDDIIPMDEEDFKDF
jgi:methyl-accepting chemotaxis protein